MGLWEEHNAIRKFIRAEVQVESDLQYEYDTSA